MKYDNTSNYSIKWNKEEEPLIFGEADPNLVKRFKEFHDENGFVYFKFFEKANQIMCKGRQKYSAWAIVNVIRWEVDLQSTGDEFYLNNDFIALYARLLMYHHPIFKNFFILRPMKPHRKMSEEQKKRILSSSYNHHEFEA